MTHLSDTGNAKDSAPDGAPLLRLKKRADFVRVAQGTRAALPGLVLQCRKAPEKAPPGAVRVGFTATKKLGGAVTRNRVKRRLRAAAAQVMPEHARPGHDYVLVGRSGTAPRPFALLVEDLRSALRQVHRRGGPDRGRTGKSETAARGSRRGR